MAWPLEWIESIIPKHLKNYRTKELDFEKVGGKSTCNSRS